MLGLPPIVLTIGSPPKEGESIVLITGNIPRVHSAVLPVLYTLCLATFVAMPPSPTPAAAGCKASGMDASPIAEATILLFFFKKKKK
jgi:hypothetical protein